MSVDYNGMPSYEEFLIEHKREQAIKQKKLQLYWKVKPYLDELQQSDLAKWLYIKNETDHPGIDPA